MSELNATPMLRQYNAIKARHPQHLLLFRMGDFYEMFHDDAKKASEILQIALTRRSAGKGQSVPLAGIPWHALDSYLAKLIRAGLKVAICEQTEDPRKAKGIVRREVTRVVTPGTVVESTILEEKKNNFLVALHPLKHRVGLAAADLSTGRFEITEFDSARASEIHSELWRFQPSEILISGAAEDFFRDWFAPDSQALITVQPEAHFDFPAARSALLEQLGAGQLDGFGADALHAAVCAAGALVHYLRETQQSLLKHLNTLRAYSPAEFMILDHATQRSLELVEGIHGGREHTLLAVLDHTLTAMGGRMLRGWLLRPLNRLAEIRQRQQAVQALVEDFALREAVAGRLRRINDVERIAGRVAVGTAHGRDLVSLRESLAQLPELHAALTRSPAAALNRLAPPLLLAAELHQFLRGALADNPPAVLREGGLIRDGFDARVDELRLITKDSKSWIARMRQAEIDRTGIQSLKIGFNKVFGYYIEVTNANRNQVPDSYIRKQTLVNAERYITPELKEKEETILNAEENLRDLEFELFRQILARVEQDTPAIQQIARAVAELDCLHALAAAAIRGNYVAPEIIDGDRIEIQDGRHPVLEAVQQAAPFVPNHCLLSNAEQQILLITGPNMAGKSTYIRQVALITLLAHVGSFVPARRAAIALCDRIFTRVGAMDQLGKGQSTFLVEMIETANILNHATDRSLVILDEIGRGTSTYDGLSIAWAVLEHLHNSPACRPKALFATHYHELIALEEQLPRLKNYNVAVLEEAERVIFLYKIERGATDRSYGIYAAKLAGVPAGVVRRATEILAELEAGRPAFAATGVGAPDDRPADAFQLTLFDHVRHPALERLQALQPDQLTPLQALNLLAELHRLSSQ